MPGPLRRRRKKMFTFFRAGDKLNCSQNKSALFYCALRAARLFRKEMY